MDDYKPQQVSTYALTLYRYGTKIENQTVSVGNSGNSLLSSNKTKLKLPIDFWDTAGQDRFESIHPSYYHQAHCAIM